MIFDTDVLIWVQRGNQKAANVINESKDRYLSVLTYMELLQAAQSRKPHEYVASFLRDLAFHR